MPYFEGATGRVYYRHWATPDPRAALVFLHGFGEHSGLYHRYAAELGAHGVDLWALDEIGHGLSDGDRGQFGSVQDLLVNARALTALAASHAPGLPLVVAGHSMGSLLALLAALDDPSAYAGVVISGAPISPLEWLAQAPAGEGGKFDLDPEALSADAFYLDQLQNDPLAFTSGDVVALLAETFPPVWARLDKELAGLPLPVLAVHGEADQVAPLDGVAAWRGRLPGLRLEVLPGAGHDVLNEVAHRQVADTVASFVLDRAGAVPAGV